MASSPAPHHLPSTPVPRDAPHPFNNREGDVIIRSSDNVDFRVFKLLLTLCSPVFRGLFELPQYAPKEEEQNHLNWKDGVPVVLLTEDSTTLTNFLSPIFPWGAIQDCTSLKEWRLVLEAAEKYQVEGVRSAAEKTLLRSKFIEVEPIGVYAIARRFDLEDTARSAARSALRQSIPGKFSDELHYASATILHDLFTYHRTCRQTAAAVIAIPKQIDPASGWNGVWFTCATCPSDPTVTPPTIKPKPYPPLTNAKVWWLHFLRELEDEVKDRPSGDTLRDWVLSSPSVKRALANVCSTCEKRIVGDTTKLAKELGEQVDRVITVVKLKCEPSNPPTAEGREKD
ncbi:hypothetical protein JAAARDRAFT_211581 [Jaapia argillacea MUCL 33604]|uniref:BTB domain-containing protein n=1 Tax=Jaapia argillacea MUCL 33604 TaxID=933084 RepID=A0A067PAA1_9AGAM|nr:hypothetical protein JAAARDRAFT_211581 [Jaapia argillacea MUCL 33604]